MIVETLSVFPDMFEGYMSTSIMGRARKMGALDFKAHDLRDWTHDRHRSTDDEPYGGGQGLLMTCPPVFEALDELRNEAAAQLDNAFAFIEGAFGAERELLVFTTELTARKATALFIARFGCAAYDRASEGLMVEEQRSELLAQMEELEF